MSAKSSQGKPSKNPKARETRADTSAAWSFESRRWIVVGLVVLTLIVVYWIRTVLDTLILAALLAYLLNPLVVGLRRLLRLPRLAAVALIYLALIGAIVTASVSLLPAAAMQVADSSKAISQWLAQGDLQLPWLSALGITLDAASLMERLRAELAALTAEAPRLALGAASSAFSLVFVLVMSFYLLNDGERLTQYLRENTPNGYRDDLDRLLNDLNDIWASFLRGQILLALIIGATTTLALVVLGVRNALLLGIVAGVLEVVPTIGPIIAMVPAVLLALFQGSSNWPIDNSVFALIVIITYIVIQQLENHLIVPMVLGRSVNLPPVVILFGALAGASLAGILGIFLAPPVLATLRLGGQYIIRKLLEPLPAR